MATLTIAEQRQLTGDVIGDNVSTSESYWRHEQDILCDVVRQRSVAPDGGIDRCYPNVFITVTAAEWRLLLHSPFFADYKRAQPRPYLLLVASSSSIFFRYIFWIFYAILEYAIFLHCY